MGKNIGELQWRVHTPNLLSEILDNPHMGILSQPLRIFGQILAEVGERAAKLNDPELNALMVRLEIYSVADPGSPDYDPKIVRQILEGCGKDADPRSASCPGTASDIESATNAGGGPAAPLTMTKTDRDVLSKTPDGWFRPLDLSVYIRCREHRCERLEKAGALVSRVVGDYPHLHREYRKK